MVVKFYRLNGVSSSVQLLNSQVGFHFEEWHDFCDRSVYHIFRRSV